MAGIGIFGLGMAVVVGLSRTNVRLPCTMTVAKKFVAPFTVRFAADYHAARRKNLAKYEAVNPKCG